jgi:hypothetical protein
MPAADISATPFGLGTLGGLSGLNGLGMGSANFMDLQQRMMQEVSGTLLLQRCDVSLVYLMNYFIRRSYSMKPL